MPDILALASELDSCNVQYQLNELLSKHTSFKIGGKADIFIEPSSVSQLIRALATCKKHNIRYFLLGKGSNVLFLDKGYNGAVIHIGKSISEITVNASTITAYAGADLASVCNTAREASLTGLEFAYGIPGCVGGAVFMNAGAYDGEIKDVIKSVTCIDSDGNVLNLSREEACFGYRMSVFQQNQLCIISAEFELSPGNKAQIADKMTELARRRAEKQPLDMPSAGSAFKRPVGAFAGALIDKCGMRGKCVGGAAISEKHCGFIVNLGNATCSDVLQLAQEVCNGVYAQTGYRLEKEIRVVE